MVGLCGEGRSSFYKAVFLKYQSTFNSSRYFMVNEFNFVVSNKTDLTSLESLASDFIFSTSRHDSTMSTASRLLPVKVKMFCDVPVV